MREKFRAIKREALKRAAQSFGSCRIIPVGISVNKMYLCCIAFIARAAWNSRCCCLAKHFSYPYQGPDSSSQLSYSELQCKAYNRAAVIQKLYHVTWLSSCDHQYHWRCSRLNIKKVIPRHTGTGCPGEP